MTDSQVLKPSKRCENMQTNLIFTQKTSEYTCSLFNTPSWILCWALKILKFCTISLEYRINLVKFFAKSAHALIIAYFAGGRVLRWIGKAFPIMCRHLWTLMFVSVLCLCVCYNIRTAGWNWKPYTKDEDTIKKSILFDQMYLTITLLNLNIFILIKNFHKTCFKYYITHGIFLRNHSGQCSPIL